MNKTSKDSSIIADRDGKPKSEGRRWSHPIRNKLEEVYCIRKNFTRPGIIYQEADSKRVEASKYSYDSKKFTERYINGSEILAVRQMYKIKLLALDIDSGSRYRHNYVGIVHALEEIGLCRSIKLLSSSSGGLHIYFPLEKPVLSEFLHVSIKAWLEHRGFEVGDGVLEIFPNAKNTQWKRDSSGRWNVEHLSRCFRLPLQGGSYVIDEDEGFVHDSKERFWLSEFDWCANGQDTESLEEYLDRPLTCHVHVGKPNTPTSDTPKSKSVKKRGRPSRVSKESQALKEHMASLDVNPRKYISELRKVVKRGWTNSSPSNYLIGAVATLASYDNKTYDEKQLAKVIQWEARTLPGYNEFASPESKRDLESVAKRSWAYRWAKSVVKYRNKLNARCPAS